MSELLTLMGVKVHSTNWCDYSNAHVPSWPAVQRHLLSHSQEVFLHHMPSEDYPHITFSPLCICLRNEVHPVPLYFIDTLLDLDARALTDDLLVNVACRTPHLSGESLSYLLQKRKVLDQEEHENDHEGEGEGEGGNDRGGNDHGWLLELPFAARKCQWRTNLHAIVSKARSVDAVQAVIHSYPQGLMKRGSDRNWSLPIHDACSEGSHSVVQLVIEEGRTLSSNYINEYGSDGNSDTYGDSDGTTNNNAHKFYGGGLLEMDEKGRTPLARAIARMDFIERSWVRAEERMFLHYQRGAGNVNGNGVSDGSRKRSYSYLDSEDFFNKGYDSWKVLVACLLGTFHTLVHHADANFQQNWDEGKALVAAAMLAGICKEGLKSNHNDAHDNDEKTVRIRNHIIRVLETIDWDQVFRLLLNPRFCNTHTLASATDHYSGNRLPFTICVDNKLFLEDGLLHIVSANPDAIFVQTSDKGSIKESLLPQMMVALRKHLGFAVMFRLLSNSPTAFALNNDCAQHMDDARLKGTCSGSGSDTMYSKGNGSEVDDCIEQESSKQCRNKKHRTGSISTLLLNR
uniref:Uncharacterized protein n=1 Tax=Chaetoceros debilis TaxID=122233 RepID=A0A7S3VCR6_9STRA